MVVLITVSRDGHTILKNSVRTDLIKLSAFCIIYYLLLAQPSPVWLRRALKILNLALLGNEFWWQGQ